MAPNSTVKNIVANELQALPFQVSGKLQDYYLNLHTHNDQALFTDLLALFTEVCTQFDATLTAYLS